MTHLAETMRQSLLLWKMHKGDRFRIVANDMSISEMKNRGSAMEMHSRESLKAIHGIDIQAHRGRRTSPVANCVRATLKALGIPIQQKGKRSH